MKLVLTILSLHFAALLLLTGHHFFTKKPLLTHRIAVRTVSPSRPQPPAVSSPSPKPSSKPASSKSRSKPAPTPKKTTPHVEETLLEELTQSLSTLSSPRPIPSRSRPDLPIPTYIEAQTDSSLDDADLLIGFLQSNLELPEQGEVTMKIAIAPSGTLLSCEILREKSRKNSEFLKKRLPELCFPCFNETTTFTITFRNVDVF